MLLLEIFSPLPPIHHEVVLQRAALPLLVLLHLLLLPPLLHPTLPQVLYRLLLPHLQPLPLHRHRL